MERVGRTVLGSVLITLGIVALFGGVILGVALPADEVSTLQDPAVEDQHFAMVLATYGTGLFVAGIVLICTGLLIMVMGTHRPSGAKEEREQIAEEA